MKNGDKVKSNNQFVKSINEKMGSMMGGKPKLKAESEKFDAYMCNNGYQAKKSAKKAAKGLDSKAFPVK